MRSIFILIVLSVLLAAAMAIICYDCDSLHEPNCDEFSELSNVKQTDCDAERPEYLLKYEPLLPATGCITKVHEVVVGDREFIRRACYYGDMEKTEKTCDGEDSYVPYANMLACTICHEDLCNTMSAGRAVGPISLSFLLVLSGVLMLSR